MKKLEELLEWGGMKRDVIFLLVSAVSLLGSIFHFSPLPFDLAWVAIVLCGAPIILEAIIGLVTAFDIKADVLVSIALIASVMIGEDFAAGEVAFIMQLGGLLERLTVRRTRAGIEKLVHLTPRSARRLTDGREEIIQAEAVMRGDVLRVLPGETIPVDGHICSGHTSVDQSVMTGESLPVDKEEGDEVMSGTVNRFGSFDMIADKVGEDSSLQRMVRLVQSADAGKAKIVGFADRFATWVVVIALAAAVITGFATGDLIRAVTILVVFCPCALVLATPTAVMAAIGNAARYGFLVREGDALERLADVCQITFDKTGTLTYGRPGVKAVRSFDGETEADTHTLYWYAASAEKRSEHPLGKAIVRCYEESWGQAGEAEDFQMLPGRGISASVEGHKILAGNVELLQDHNIEVKEERLREGGHFLDEGSTVIWLAADGRLAGFIALEDTVRETAAGTIDQIKELGIAPVLLTGDHENAARHIAGELGIEVYRAGCLPEDKLRFIGEGEEQGQKICMIGDGINDAPALKKAYVGIAMGGVGSDIAVDAADIVLVNDEIRRLPHLLRLSRRMMATIRRNLTFSMTLNVIAIILAVMDVLNPVTGALVHNAGSVLVIVSSALLLRWKN